MSIGRIVCAGGVPGRNIKAARKVLRLAGSSLDTEGLIAPGGFVKFKIPTVYNLSRGWKTKREDYQLVANKVADFYAQELADEIPHSPVLRYITMGIDLYDITDTKLGEFVLIHDILKHRLYITGKSFPRTDEENELVLAPPDSHFVKINGRQRLFLGCHDLNIWSGRSSSNTIRRERNRVRRTMRALARSTRPYTVIHHAHATDSEKTWQAGWSGLLSEVKPKEHALALGFYNGWGRKVEGFRSPLEIVQNTYHSGNVEDRVFVF
jgi:hypothetical protein